MNALIIKLMAVGLTVSQVFTKSPDQVRTQFNPQTDQAIVAQHLKEGCGFMMKQFKTEKIDIEPTLLLMIENEKRAREQEEANRTPVVTDEGDLSGAPRPPAPAVAPVAPPADFREQLARDIDVEMVLTLYKAFCKNEQVDLSKVKYDEVINYYNEQLKNLPDLNFLKTYKLPESTVVLDRNGERFSEIFEGNRRKFVPISQIPKHVIDAFIAIEDKTFHQHNGLDPSGVARAIYSSAVGSGRPQGGSTITQQLIKNLVLNDDLTFERKMREMVLAHRLDAKKILKKEEILELYLNMIFLGRSSWGVEMAAQSYFKKSIRDVTPSEAALLAGLTAGPGSFSPDRDLEKATRRRQNVLFEMKKNGSLTDEAFKLATAEPIKDAVKIFESPSKRGGYYFLDVIKREAKEIAKVELNSKSHIVKSTIHAQLQKEAERALQEGLHTYEINAKRYGDWQGARDNLANEMKRAGANWKDLLKRRFETFDHQWPLAIVLSTRPYKVGLLNGKELPLQGALTNRLKLHDLVFVNIEGEKEAETAKLKITPVVVGSIKREITRYQTTWQDSLQRARGQFYDVPWTIAVVLNSRQVGLADGRTLPLRGNQNLINALEPYDLIFVNLTQGREATATLKIPPAVQGAVVVMENRTGRVLAMAGGFSYGDSKYNRAYDAARQPGSTLKPFVYLAALNLGFQPNTLIPDTPYPLPPLERGQQPWTPRNYDRSSRGLVTMRRAIEQSLNLPTVRMMAELGRTPSEGLDYVRGITQELGIYKNPTRYYPFVLGADPARLLDMASAYAAVANSPFSNEKFGIKAGEPNAPAGLRPKPRFFDTIEADGRMVFPQPRFNLQPSPSIDAVSYFQLRRILEGTLERGTATALKDMKGFVAGKTGTSNNVRDVWFAGFTNDIVVITWVGYDNDNVHDSLGDRYTGGRLALPIAEKILRASFQHYRQPEALAGPSQFLRSETADYAMDLVSGEFGGNFRETFRRDEGGRNIINSHRQILKGGENMLGYGQTGPSAEEMELRGIPGWGPQEDRLPPGYYRPQLPPGYYNPGYEDQYEMWRQRQRQIDPYYRFPFGGR